jgi:hypothetical protein
MTLAIILVIAAAVALVFILGITVSRSPRISRTPLAPQIQPVDLEAFRNLLDPGEDRYLRRRLPPAEFRRIQRQRLLAMAAYIRVAAHNARVLVQIGQAALSANDAHTVVAARQLVDNALLLRRNAALAILRIYIAIVWPTSALAAAPILHGYVRLSGSAMLLGRLQNPAIPVRISAAS